MSSSAPEEPPGTPPPPRKLTPTELRWRVVVTLQIASFFPLLVLIFYVLGTGIVNERAMERLFEVLVPWMIGLLVVFLITTAIRMSIRER